MLSNALPKLYYPHCCNEVILSSSKCTTFNPCTSWLMLELHMLTELVLTLTHSSTVGVSRVFQQLLYMEKSHSAACSPAIIWKKGGEDITNFLPVASSSPDAWKAQKSRSCCSCSGCGALRKGQCFLFSLQTSSAVDRMSKCYPLALTS